MKAIILSAGQGRRLLPLTEARPKCALPVAGRTVLEWQLHELAQCALDEVVVVTGFGADIVDEIVGSVPDINARTSYNPFYGQTDNLGTCWVVRAEMTPPFMIINGDTLFEAAVAQRLLDTDSMHPITIVTDSKSGYDEDDMKVIAEGNHLHRVSKQLDPASVTGESIGMMSFRGAGASLFTGRLEHLMRYGHGDRKWYLSAIDDLARDGHVGVCPINGLSWCEIDDHEDLRAAEVEIDAWYRSAPVRESAR